MPLARSKNGALGTLYALTLWYRNYGRSIFGRETDSIFPTVKMQHDTVSILLNSPQVIDHGAILIDRPAGRTFGVWSGNVFNRLRTV